MEFLGFTKIPRLTRYWGQDLSHISIGALVKVQWRDIDHDWPYFWLIDKGRGRIKLKGADYPDGSARHDGDVFWVSISETNSIESVG